MHLKCGFHCQRHILLLGECAQCGAIQFHDFVTANNLLAGIEYFHIKLQNWGSWGTDYAMVKNAVIIASLEYEGHPRATKRGLVLPFDSGL